MKHRRHPDFPSYRFYKDGRIMNRTTGKFLKEDVRHKLINKDGHRQTIAKQRILRELFPELRPQPKPKLTKHLKSKKRYTPTFVKAIKKAYEEGDTWDNICKRFGIPFGSMSYIMRMVGKRPTADVRKVVIYFK